jgi:hypothetical protein
MVNVYCLGGKGYRRYTSLNKGENPRNPPKSPLERGTLKAPFPRGLGDLDLETKSSQLVCTQ